jgi:dienelactone hydrolase
MKTLITSLILVLFPLIISGQNNLSEKDLIVLNQPADTMMRSYLTNLVDMQFAKRDSLLSTLRSAEDWRVRSEAIRDSMISWTGPLPERTPLNARVTGRIEREDYIIENILFESRPNYFVSANLYLPKGYPLPRPALLHHPGHSAEGKSRAIYQRPGIAGAKNGFVVLTMDCLGQGERQVNEYASLGSAPGNAHRIIGTQAFISGTHVFNIMVWDAIRAIDYLESRPEVDPDKICMTGTSGGGMMTTYILPFDDRISVAVPACNPNTWSHRVHAGLSTDHEQVFFGAFESNIDPRGDPLFCQVPKPLLINATTDDNLNPPRGVWELSTWLFKSYSSHGMPEKFTATMVRAGHAFNQEQLEIAFSWMLRWTGNDILDFWEADTPLEKEESLLAAAGGSVFNEPGSRSDQDLVWDYLRENRANWGEIKNTRAVKAHKAEMTTLIEGILNTNLGKTSAGHDLRQIRTAGDINIRHFTLEPELGILLPGVLLGNDVAKPGRDVILYLNENGKSNILNDMEVLEDILGKGYIVCAVDLRGFGETSPDMSTRFWDFLAGKPIFGQRVVDVLSIVEWLKDSEIKARDIKLWGSGMCSLYGAFAGVLSDDITSFVFEKPLLSFESVVKVKVPRYNHEILLPGILEKFDMTQIYQALSPRPVLVLNPNLGDKTPAGLTEIKKIADPVSTTYLSLRRAGAWQIISADEVEREKIIRKSLAGS